MTATDPSWALFLRELDWYVAKYGTAAVPQTTTTRKVKGNPYPLGRRVNTVRQSYRKGALAPERIAELESRGGWRWENQAARKQDTWARNYDAVAAWAKDTGSLAGINPSLNTWLQRQRRADQEDRLNADQRRQLHRIPGALEGTYSRADQFVTAVRRWIRANPGKTTADITRNDTIDVDGQTIRLQRRVTYYRGRYFGLEGSRPPTPQEISKIAELPGWTWTPSRGPHSRTKPTAKTTRAGKATQH